MVLVHWHGNPHMVLTTCHGNPHMILTACHGNPHMVLTNWKQKPYKPYKTYMQTYKDAMKTLQGLTPGVMRTPHMVLVHCQGNPHMVFIQIHNTLITHSQITITVNTMGRSRYIRPIGMVRRLTSNVNCSWIGPSSEYQLWQFPNHKQLLKYNSTLQTLKTQPWSQSKSMLRVDLTRLVTL